MKPASAMSLALRKPGRSALVSAAAGMDLAAMAVIAANAAEQKIAFCERLDTPSSLQLMFKRACATSGIGP